MISIYRYPLSRMDAGRSIVCAPIIKPLHVAYQNNVPMLLAVVDTSKKSEEWVVFQCLTDWSLDGKTPQLDFNGYLNTTDISGEPFVFHWFCQKLIEGFDL